MPQLTRLRGDGIPTRKLGGVPALNGTLSQTLSDLTASAQAKVTIAGALSKSLAPLTLSAQATVTTGATATLSKTLGALTVTSAGKVAIEGVAQTAAITLAWDASVGATGYKIYVGTSTGVYDYPGSPFDVGNVLTYRLQNFPNDTYYFAVTAYNESGESGFSNELVDTISAVNGLVLSSLQLVAVGTVSVSTSVTVGLTGVAVTARVGSATTGSVIVVGLTGVGALAGSNFIYTPVSGGGVFPDEILPDEVFPPSIFPSGSVYVTETTGGVGVVVPNSRIVFPSIEGFGTVGFASAGSDRADFLTGVVATASAGSLVQSHACPLTSAQATGAAGTLRVAEGNTASGVVAQAAVGTVVNSIAVGLTGVSATVAVSTITVGEDRLYPLSGVEATATVQAVVESTAVPLVSASATASATSVFIMPPGVALTGVGATVNLDSIGKTFHKTLPSVTAIAAVGYLPKEGDVILDTVGVSANAGSVGSVGIGLPVLYGIYRHSGPQPIRKRPVRDLVSLEREMALMED